MSISSPYQWNRFFIRACEMGQIHDLRTACQKQYLDLGWADIHADFDYGFRSACKRGHLEVVKYLLTSKELIEAGHFFADLHAHDDEAIFSAFHYGHLDLVKYFLTSPDLKESGHRLSYGNFSPSILTQGLITSCTYRHHPIARWLILELGVEKTPTIERFMAGDPLLQDYFRTQQELKQLQAVIPLNTSNPLNTPHYDPERAAKKAKKL